MTSHGVNFPSTDREEEVPKKNKSVDPESNQGPSDLQSDALPTELSTGAKDR